MLHVVKNVCYRVSERVGVRDVFRHDRDIITTFSFLLQILLQFNNHITCMICSHCLYNPTRLNFNHDHIRISYHPITLAPSPRMKDLICMAGKKKKKKKTS